MQPTKTDDLLKDTWFQVVKYKVRYVEVVDTQRLIVACHRKTVWCVIQQGWEKSELQPDLVLLHFKT